MVFIFDVITKTAPKQIGLIERGSGSGSGRGRGSGNQKGLQVTSHKLQEDMMV
jgi:hypothetical protein